MNNNTIVRASKLDPGSVRLLNPGVLRGQSRDGNEATWPSDPHFALVLLVSGTVPERDVCLLWLTSKPGPGRRQVPESVKDGHVGTWNSKPTYIYAVAQRFWVDEATLRAADKTIGDLRVENGWLSQLQADIAYEEYRVSA
ncbi:MAG: hypothetical protein H6700_05215 [Myxococcales bacterium]|nr:hypothetical protein [Myxococcales bacterium]